MYESTEGPEHTATSTSTPRSEFEKDSSPETSTPRLEAELIQPGNESLEEIDEKFERPVNGVKWFLVCVGLYLCCLIYGLDTTITADIQVPIVRSLDHVEQLTWLGTGFPMGSLWAVLPSATAYSLFDMKYLLIASIILFEVGSAICGAAPTMDALILGRVIAGVGGSGMYLGLLGYLTVCTSNKERAVYMAGVGFTWGLGSILGPIVGGLFAESAATWRWAFYINLVVAGICAPIYIFCLPPIKPADSSSFLRRLGKIDWAGTFVSAAFICCLAVAFTFAGNTWAWNDGKFIALLVLSVFFCVLLAAQQTYHIFTTVDTRLFPTDLVLFSKTQLLLAFQATCAIGNIHIPLNYLSLYFQFVREDNAMQAAVRLLPFMMFLIFTNLINGFMLPKIGFVWPLYLATGILITTGGALLHTITAHTPLANVYGYSIVIAVGTGLTMTAGYAIASIKMSLKGGSPKDIGSSISFQNLCQTAGAFLALLISGQIFQSFGFQNLKGVLEIEGFTDVEIRSALSGSHSAVLQSLSPATKILATEAIARAISKVYILSVVLGALSLIASLCLKRDRLFVPREAVVPGG